MADVPAITVVITTYNIESYVIDCVNSVLQNDFQDYEILLIDDCSTDNTFKICEHMANSNEKIRAIQRKKNGGAEGMLKRNKEKADYLYNFLDSSDFYHATAQKGSRSLMNVPFLTKETDAERAKEINAKFVKEAAEEGLVNLAGHRLVGGMRASIYNAMTLIVNEWAKGETALMIWLNFYRRDFLISNEIRFAEMIAEDMTFSLIDISFAEKYLKIPQAVYLHRVRQGSLVQSKSKSHDRLFFELDSFLISTRYIEHYLKKLPTFSTDKYKLEEILIIWLQKFFNGYSEQFFNADGNLEIGYMEIIEEVLRKNFSKNIFFVKFLFINYNILRLQNKNMIDESNKLKEARGGGI